MMKEFSDPLSADFGALLSEIAAKLSDPQDPIALYNTVVQICRERFQAEASSLYLEEPGGTTVNMVAGKGYSENIVGQARYERNEGVTGHVWALGHSFKANNRNELLKHPWFKGKMDKSQWEKGRYAWSLIVVPLKIGIRVLGVLKVENKKPEPAAFSDSEYQLLQTIASVLSLAVENARLAERSHTRVLDALQKTVEDLSGEGSYFSTILYGQVVETCREIFGAEAASLYLESNDRNNLTMVAGDGYSRVLMGEASYHRNEGITGHVWGEGVSVKIDDVVSLKAHPWHTGKYDGRQWTGKQYAWSLLQVPLKIRDHVVGVLKVENKLAEPNCFTVAEQRLLQMIASIVALSVHNERSVRRLHEGGLLAYDYAHTCKGDMAIVSNSVHALRQGVPRGAQSGNDAFLTAIENVVEDMNRRAVEILDISKESHAILEVIRLIDLHDLLGARWVWILQQRDIRLVNELKSPNASLVADRTMLLGILDNLVQNAIEAISTRQQNVSEYQGKIGLFASVSEDTVSIYVCDDALGIPAENRLKLFQERFTTKPGGTGLGLTIVRRYVEANRGKVGHSDDLPPDVSSETVKCGWKAVFCLTLPRGQSEQLYSVLVVDDSKRFHEYMCAEFARRPTFGDIDWAEDIAGAIASVTSKEYDAVILDMWFGKPPQGCEAYQRLRNAGYRGLVIITSAHQELLEEAHRLEGVADVIAKEDARSIPDRCENLLRQQGTLTQS